MKTRGRKIDFRGNRIVESTAYFFYINLHFISTTKEILRFMKYLYTNLTKKLLSSLFKIVLGRKFRKKL